MLAALHFDGAWNGIILTTKKIKQILIRNKKRKSRNLGGRKDE